MRMVKEHIATTLDPKLVDKLDKARGDMPRAYYMRSLIEADLAGLSVACMVRELTLIIKEKNNTIAEMRRDALAIMALSKNMANAGRIK